MIGIERVPKLHFLNIKLFSKFADIEGDCETVKTQLEQRGFRVICEPYFSGTVLLRLNDKHAPG
jgi:hypothetical protein